MFLALCQLPFFALSGLWDDAQGQQPPLAPRSQPLGHVMAHFSLVEIKGVLKPEVSSFSGVVLLCATAI